MKLEEALLNKLQEEAAEIVQAAAKCMQFTSAHRYHGYKNTNGERLIGEIGDLLGVLKLLRITGVIQVTDLELETLANEKVTKTINGLETSYRIGTIDDISLLTRR